MIRYPEEYSKQWRPKQRKLGWQKHKKGKKKEEKRRKWKEKEQKRKEKKKPKKKRIIEVKKIAEEWKI